MDFGAENRCCEEDFYGPDRLDAQFLLVETCRNRGRDIVTAGKPARLHGMVPIDIAYAGQLHTVARHGPSGATLETDAPKDNNGKGEAFSPTDLLATALGTCMLTVMGIIARRDALPLEGTQVHVEKEMTATPPRKVARLTVAFKLPAAVPSEDRPRLESAAHACPVKKSLHPDVDIAVTFDWSL